MPAESVIERLRRLEAEATKGPWRVHWWSDARDPEQVACGIDGPEHFGFCGDDSNDIVRASKYDSGVSTGANADLIASMRNALPLLLRVAEAAEKSADWPSTQDCDYSVIQRELESAVRALRAGGSDV